jgi:hypothetical protein
MLDIGSNLVQNHMYSCLVSKNLNIKIYKICFFQLFGMDVKLHLTQMKSKVYVCVWSEGAKEDIWT